MQHQFLISLIKGLDVSNIVSCKLVSPNKEILPDTEDKFPKLDAELKLLLTRFKFPVEETGIKIELETGLRVELNI